MKRFMGLDPGPSTGIVWGSKDEWTGKPKIDGIVQCHGSTSPFIYRNLLRELAEDEWYVQGETFQVTSRAGTTGADAQFTREVVDGLQAYVTEASRYMKVHWHSRPPALMKPWLTPNRLKAVQFPLGTKFKDARDALGHMLFTACRDGGCRDPLA